MTNIIKFLNIKDHLGKVYYPEVLYSVCYNFSGVNSKKLENSYQMKYYLKKLKTQYRGLGTKVKWCDLYGTRSRHQKHPDGSTYGSPSAITAAEYLAAMKVLYMWRNFKMKRRERRDEMMMMSYERNA